MPRCPARRTPSLAPFAAFRPVAPRSPRPAATPHAASTGVTGAKIGIGMGVGQVPIPTEGRGACGACGASAPYPLQMGVVLKLVCEGLYDRWNPVRHILRHAFGDIRDSGLF